MGWLTAKGVLGLARWAWIMIAALAIGAVILIADNAIEDTIETAKGAGAIEAVAAGQDTTLSQIGKAHAAGDEVRNDRGNARYDRCVRDSAAGYESSCRRYLKDQPVPGRSGVAGEGGS